MLGFHLGPEPGESVRFNRSDPLAESVQGRGGGDPGDAGGGLIHAHRLGAAAGGMEAEAAEMAEYICHPHAGLDHGGEPFVGILLVEIGPGLVGIEEVDPPTGGTQDGFEHGVGGAMQDSGPLFQPLLGPHRQIVALHYLDAAGQLPQQVNDQTLAAIHAGGGGLDHQPVVVAVHDQPRQEVPFGPHQPMARPPTAAASDRGLEPGAQEGRIDRLLASGEQTHRDLRPGGHQTGAHDAAPGMLDHHRLAIRQVLTRLQVTAVHPQVPPLAAMAATIGKAQVDHMDARGADMARKQGRPARRRLAASRVPGMDDAKPDPCIRRLGWLHFLNDLTLDFLTPLLPAGVGIAWIGVMEGVADAVGQALRLVTGRASDRSGRRVPWVRGGYLINAMARPLTAIGMVAALPVWIMGCRVLDRVGKGLRGSATDALVADWTEGGGRIRAFAWMRTMDHLGATVGGLLAALCSWFLPADQLWLPVAGLVAVTAVVAWLAGGLQDRPLPGRPAGPPAGWWPRATVCRRPLLAVAVAGLAVRLSPLLILAHAAGLGQGEATERWPLWLICLGWAAFGLVQAMAAGGAGWLAGRIGPAATTRMGWLASAVVLAGLGVLDGLWLAVAALAAGIVSGLTEGSEKAWFAGLLPAEERAVGFGALALVTAGAGLVGNAAAGLLLAFHGAWVLYILAVLALAGTAFAATPRRSPP